MQARLPTSLPGRIAAIVAAAVVLLVVVAQLFVPRLGENAIEDRLTDNGGVAEVKLEATPAARLLWGSGDRLSVDATGLELDVTRSEDPVVFDDLDRFDDIEIIIRDSSAGPVQLDTFILSRKSDEPYDLEARGDTSVSELAEYAADDFDLPGGGVVGTILDFTGIGGSDIEVDLDMKIESDEGRIRVVEGGGEIAGIPTGPLAEIITAAVTVEL